MPVFSWRRRTTRHFGDRWYPFAEVELQGANGQFQAFVLPIDSGAVVSLLRRSAADLLGIPLEKGRRIDLSAVGGGTTYAYVHDIPTHMEDLDVLVVPFAIAETESVPNLLGRHVIFDACQSDFDCSLQETRVTAGWLTDQQAQIWRFMLVTDRHVLSRWREKPLPGRGDEAAERFIRRGGQLLAAIAGLIKLHREYECPGLIRSLLELALQLEYLLRDPAPQAEAYFDYEHVAKYEQIQAIVAQPVGTIARELAYSPDGISGEARARAEYDRVRPRFQRGARTWDAWYCKSVRDLAATVGRLPEYQFWYKMCSAWAHGDPFRTRQDQLLDKSAVFIASMCYYGRMLLQIAEAKAILLSAEQYDVLRKCDRGLI